MRGVSNHEAAVSLDCAESDQIPFINAFLTIDRAKIAELAQPRRTGEYPWTPVQCLTFETAAPRPPPRRLARVNGIRGGKQVPW